MPNVSPSSGDVHVNRPLTNISIAYMQDDKMFVAGRVFANIPVTKQSDAYFTYERGSWNRDDMRERAPGTESAGGSYEIATETYYARNRAYHKDIPDIIADNADNPINLDREATGLVTLKGLINREVDFSKKFFVKGLWRFNVDGVAANPTAKANFTPLGDGAQGNNDILKWSDAASTPITDIRFAATVVQQETGFRPNVLVLSRFVYDALIDHPDVIGRLDRGQTQGPAQANRESLAALLEMEEVVVMESVVNNGKIGGADNHVFIGGKHAGLFYRPPTPGIMTPAAGYTFNWTGRFGASDLGVRIKSFRMEHLESKRVEAQQSFDQKQIGAELGYFFADII
jgi:Phage major capsid protein E